MIINFEKYISFDLIRYNKITMKKEKLHLLLDLKKLNF